MLLSVLARHKKIGLQFSGGKDSLAVLELMRPFLDLMTVYWLNSGDAFPENIEFVRGIGKKLPHFVEIEGRKPLVEQTFGWSSDILPIGSMPMGRMLDHKDQPMIDRYSCCARSIMEPMHERMIEDEITLLIRGQKNADKLKPSPRSGTRMDGFEVFYPIEEWTDKEVFDFLKLNGVKLPPFYPLMSANPDCMHCTAWLEHGLGDYARATNPTLAKELQRRFTKIADTLDKPLALLTMEIV